MGSEAEGISESRIRSPGCRSLALLCAATLLLQACATAPNIEEKTKAGYGKIGLVTASLALGIDNRAMGGFLVGAAGFAGTLAGCVSVPLACPAIIVPGVVGSIAAGGVAAASDPESGLDIEMQLVQDALRTRVMAYASQQGVGPLAIIDDSHPSTPEGSPNYQHLSNNGIDTVLEVQMFALGLISMGVFSDIYLLRATARARVIRVSDQAVISDEIYGLWGGQAVLESWVEENGRLYQTWVKHAYATMAEYIINGMILRYTPISAENIAGATIVTGSALSKNKRLSGLTAFGIHPKYPELHRETCFLCKTWSNHAFTEIDTLRPEFRWQPLVGVEQSGDNKVFEKIQGVNYEIRLFTAQQQILFALGNRIVPALLDGPTLRRSDLVEPRHQFEQSLAPCTKYFWTVRADFRIDGRPRLTEWANLHGQPWRMRRHRGVERGGSPAHYYLPFQTHCPANARAN